MGIIAKYKFNNTLADLLPEFNSEFTSDLYTITDEVNGDVTTRTIESDSLPTLMRFGSNLDTYVEGSELALLEVLDMNTNGLTNCYRMFRYCKNLTTITCEWNTANVVSMGDMFYGCSELTSLDVSGFDTSNVIHMYSTFYNCSKLTSLDVSNFDTANVSYMNSMFYNCSKLTSLDVSNFDTAKVTDMSAMFQNCSSLTSLDVSGFDTTNVTRMGGIFAYCSELTSLDVSGFDTSNVTSMDWMFRNCSKLTSLDVSNFDTANVTQMNNMFNDCSSLASLDVSNFDTSKVTNIWSMFQNCSSLTSLDVSGFDTSKFISTNAMFYACSSLTSLDVSGFDTGNVTNMGNMFSNCKNLTSLDLSGFDTSKVTEMSYMFRGCNNLTSLDLSNFDTSKVTSMNAIFYNCNKLTTLDISNFDTSKVTDFTNILTSTSSLKYIKCNNVSTLNTLNTLLPTKTSDNQGIIICKSDITDLDITTLQSKYWTVDTSDGTMIAKYKFDKSIYNSLIPEFNSGFSGYFCNDEIEDNIVTREIVGYGGLPTLMRFGRMGTSSSSLLEILDMDTSALTSMWGMFSHCNNLTSVSCNWNTTLVTDMWAVFSNCNKLTSVDVSNWDTSKVNNMNYLFGSCANLVTLDVSNWDTSNVTTMYQMFYNCNKLTSLDISNWHTSNVLNMSSMFSYCSNLTSLDVSNWDTNNVTDITDIFTNTPLLADIGVLYMDKSSLQKLVDAMPTDLNKTLWYKDVNIDGITHGSNITLKKYTEGNVEIVLNSPLLEGDRIEVKDGKLCHYHKMGMEILDGRDNEAWKIDSVFDNTIYFYKIPSKQAKPSQIPICDKIKGFQIGNNDSAENIFIYSTGNLNISVFKSKLSTLDVNGFKQWLQANPTTTVYELASPYYEDITPLQSSIALRTFEECNIQIITALPIKTKITYRTNITSAIVMEQELDTLDSGVSLSNLIEEEVNE